MKIELLDYEKYCSKIKILMNVIIEVNAAINITKIINNSMI